MKRAFRIVVALVILLMAAFLLARTPDTDPQEMRAKYGAPPSQFVTLNNGLTVHLRDEGPREGRVIVLLHGSNADLHTWDPWVELLKERYRLVRFDQRGHGLTGPAREDDYSRAAFAGDIEGVAQALGLKRFVLAGNSMGGAIALQYALDHPERLDGLVLIDAAGAPIEARGRGNTLFTLARIPLVNRLMTQITPRSLVEKSLSQSVANQKIVTDEAVDRYWELARIPGNRRATVIRFSQGYRPFASEQLSAVKVPTLVMWGERDSLIPFEAAKWFARHLPNAQLVSYPEIGHIPMEEDPQSSARDLASWIETLDEAQ